MSSVRSQVVTRRTYNRPLDAEGLQFESWEDTCNRVIEHQQWLWSRAKGEELTQQELEELGDLRQLMVEKKASVSGRTLWLGGTDVAKKREASMFNCSFTRVETVRDCVDCLWLLMQGCGVGFSPVVGTLNGFFQPIKELEVVRSQRTTKGGNPRNVEFVKDGVWTIRVGDSAESWSKSIGKLLAGKHAVDKLVLDFSEIRPSGERLSGYGWISSGDSQIATAFSKIFDIMNLSAGQLLTRINILDIVNLLGTILSSRRSAEIALFCVDQPEAKEFAYAKKDMYSLGLSHREQSNNSLLFNSRPTFRQLRDVFDIMLEGGGSEPGFINAQSALQRAPWFAGINPCAEILLPNKGFCNLVEINVSAFDNEGDLDRAIRVCSRANYRQTLVDLRDGILQEAWHTNNVFLRLCGVGLTGLAQSPELLEGDRLARLRTEAHKGAYSMANELGLQLPKNVTTIKPSGTLSKVFDCTEGAHDPVGEFIFNNINFSVHDPLVTALKDCGYRVRLNPSNAENALVTLPVSFEGASRFNATAIQQLERYIFLQQNWTDQNTSITVTYEEHEVDLIISFLLEHWDDVVGVSFILRDDTTYLYLPQEVVTEEEYNEYVAKLKPFNLDDFNTLEELDDDECTSGHCPVK